MSRRTLLGAAAATAVSATVLPALGGPALANPPAPRFDQPLGNLTGAGTIRNLPDSFYDRPGLAGMPRIDYAALPVVNVRDHGAAGDGVTSDVAAFNRSLAALRAAGGGIMYLPSGRYLFPPPPLPGNDWWFQGDIRNIHFVGEGESSVLLFQRPVMRENGREAPPYPSGQGWQFQTAVNVSLRDLAIQWAPLNMLRHNATATALIVRTPQAVQILRVTVDHCQPGIILQNARDCWMVGNTLRNGGSDAYNYGGAANSVAAYNWAESIGDDGIANWHDSNRYPDSTVTSGVRFEHNTVINACYGRGMTLGGAGHTIAHNWIETTMGCAIFGDISTSANPATLIDARVEDNHLVRSALEMRPDNRALRPGGGFQGAVSFINKVDTLTITGNSIRGSQSNDITIGVQNWLPVTGRQITISDNELLAANGAGLRVSPGTVVDGLVVEDNRVLGNTGAAVSVAGTATGVTSAGNLVTRLPELDGGTVDGDLTGFRTTGLVGYRDPYADRRAEPSETAWAEPTERPLNGLRVANVRRFGARGDGRHDDTPAFRAALASLPASGGVIKVPAGRYRLVPDERHSAFRDTRIPHHFAIAERDNVHLVGVGEHSEIVLSSPDHQGVRIVGGTGCSVSRLRFTLPARPALRHNRALLELSGVKDGSVTDVRLRGASGANLLIDTCTGVLVRGVRTEDANLYGIDVGASRQVRVTGCTAVGNRDGGIHVSYVGTVFRDCQYVRVDGNTVDGVTEGAGILVASGTAVEVTGNTVRDTCQAGIYLYGRSPIFPTHSVAVTGNTVVRACTGALCVTPGAIAIHSVRHQAGTAEGFFTVAGNTVTDVPFSGVWVGGQSPIGRILSQINTLTVTGNTFTGVSGSPLLIYPDQRAQIVNLTTD
ncbi:right-handed parallel beta-helix repeat-containing protein [Dactylosporangium fulvum]|uniref:Right-handed parallel beta-helix repeat-containing protein n=1 Tax=Dactylosporangium fulvum TaxID=53359 RepID=A0ABY5W243_9ACTN|nr:right-handed parallel beta-helix repeat-containing protein [Dactylosporangium fulvum]UWP83114.1 right-handed parallel beta-helix repeat-containing protein [Dactylosporangium fulvum]